MRDTLTNLPLILQDLQVSLETPQRQAAAELAAG